VGNFPRCRHFGIGSKYGAGLLNEILSGKADQNDQLREEIRTTFMRHVNELELRYRKSRWNLLPQWLR